MILEALVNHYDRLAEDPNADIAAYGFSSQKVSFCVVINPDGTLHDIESMSDDSSGKARNLELVVPGQAKPSGSGINPCFLWDNASYLLGFVPEDATEKKASRAVECFGALRDRHLALQQQINDPHFDAVCSFLKSWELSGLPAGGAVVETLSRPGFGVFRLKAAAEFVHERPAVRDYWLSQLEAVIDPEDAEASRSGRCLVTGEISPIARLHEPKIKGVSGAQSSGAAIVSFNEKAYESQGKEQGDNSPVSESAAFRYATALNHLLADRRHRVQLGDTTCVFWTDKPQTGAADAVADAMDQFWAGEYNTPEDQQAETRSALRDFLNRFRQAKAAPGVAGLEDADAPFYVLGLAPNAARISVRFWLRFSVRELAQNLDRHVRNTEIFDSRSQCVVQPTMRELLRETGRESKDIPPQLSGELARAVLQNLKYPQLLAISILRRMKADQANDQRPPLNASRAAGLKAWLNRNYEMELTMSLDPQRTEPAYLLGRLFAAYEKVQEDSAGGKLNRTIRDSYLSSASATPAGIFPRLYRLSQHHFNKLRREKPGLAVLREKLIGEICNPLTDFPTHLKLPDQGLFAIGYYHQTQDFYTKREEPASPDTPTPSEED